MNLKTISIRLSVITAMWLCVISFPAVAKSDAILAGKVDGGGQAPPAAAGGSSKFAVLVADDLSQATADGLRDSLVKEGFTSAETRQTANGSFQVMLGGLTAKGQADALFSELQKGGYTPDRVIEITKAPTGSRSSGESVYRVEVAEFSTANEADQARKVLADDGFVNVDIVEENGKHLLMMGTFNRKSDAEALLTDVNKAGFAMASVVSRERLGDSGGGYADADLSGLSAAEQAETRDVLAMAERVESGEASAADMKQLREVIQQLTENQRAILGRQENNRIADNQKLQRIFTLYRQFDKAISSHDFTAAEKALAEVKQIDPTEMFLSNRLKALEDARSGRNAAPTGTAAVKSTAVDPAVVQNLINEARSLEAAEKPAEALQKYRQVVAMDPTNVEARGKIAELDPAGTSVADADDAGGLMSNKNLIYGGAALAALILLGLWWMRSRGGKKTQTPPAGISSGPDFIDPLADGGGYTGSAGNTPTGTAPGGGSALAGASLAGFGDLHDESEEEEQPSEPKIAAPTPAAPPVEESVSLEGFDNEPATTNTPPPAAATTQSDDMVSINFDEHTVAPVEETPAADSPSPIEPTLPEVSEPVTAKPSSAMDADLEALLRGTVSGDSEGEPVAEGIGDNFSAEELNATDMAEGVMAPGNPGSQIIFQQSFDNESEGASPAEWRGEYDYASLSVAVLGEAGHSQSLKYEKPEGVGSATYHLSFPPARGRVTAEFDVRCDEKNKFLLGIYLERDEDFKQSVHTIVHHLDPNAPASLRIQGEPSPYEMGSWRQVRYEIDLINSTVNGYLDGEQIIKDSHLATSPEYLNTLSIRDNLATTGTLYLDNIRISEG